MKAVMISVTPKMCEKVASGDCTILVRKTRPKIDIPFKCYIYCSQGEALAPPCLNNPNYAIHRTNNGTPNGRKMTAEERKQSDYLYANGKVIGEFVCGVSEYFYDQLFDESMGCFIDSFGYDITSGELEQTCLSYEEFEKYGNTNTLYGWHISDLVIYHKPREIGEFFCKCNRKYCTGCEDFCDEGETIFRMCGGLKAVTRPPQSWQYVEELKENEK